MKTPSEITEALAVLLWSMAQPDYPALVHPMTVGQVSALEWASGWDAAGEASLESLLSYLRGLRGRREAHLWN